MLHLQTSIICSDRTSPPLQETAPPPLKKKLPVAF
uniref:Uncharacterized protein n=1 Tax=Anguilla anguilla TaxID=7936 RepID=A0A0E9R7C9_ANGAN